MAKPEKVAAVNELAELFSNSSAAVLTEYRGLTVADLKNLRRSLGGASTYAVAKNTLTKIAANQAGIEGLDDLLSGPTAIAFLDGDVAEGAKALRDFAKAAPLLVVKGGVMDGRVLDADQVKKLADLESREVLLAKLAGAMKGSLQNAVSLFAAPMATAARAFGALQKAAEENPSLIGGAGTPAAAESTSEPAAADVESEAPADAAAEPETTAETEVAPESDTQETTEAAASTDTPTEPADGAEEN